MRRSKLKAIDPYQLKGSFILRNVKKSDSESVDRTVTQSGCETNNKLLFNVLWGKQSNKKHKTWEGDGTLEVSNNAAVLKGENGEVLGRSNKIKVSELVEGYQLFVGSKQVEIVEQCLEQAQNQIQNRFPEEHVDDVQNRLHSPTFSPVSSAEDIDSLNNIGDIDYEEYTVGSFHSSAIEDAGNDVTINHKIVYTVVHGKQTNKKHKTFDSDGSLEVCDDIAVLRGENGTILGKKKLKSDVCVGTQLLVGNREVEIVSKVNNGVDNDGANGASRGPFTAEGESFNPIAVNVERSKCDKKFVDPLTRTKNDQFMPLVEFNHQDILDKNDDNDCGTAKRNLFHPTKKQNDRQMKRMKLGRFCSPLKTEEKDTDLIMPRPDLSHQWKYNKEKRAVVDVKLCGFLNRVLRPHQREGIVFLYTCVTGIRNLNQTGAILADEMGLGKTLQCIALIWLLLKNGPYGGVPLVKRVLIVTPSSLVNNWQKELKQWIGTERLTPFVINQKQKPHQFKSNMNQVMIISYEMVMRHHEDMIDLKFDLMICDEGHRLKNNNIRTSILLDQLGIRRRIILTGTPVQNDLQEFFGLIDFVNKGVLGTYGEFKNNYEDPIVSSNRPDCDEEVKALGEFKAAELNGLTNLFVMRRTQDIINQYLPSKQECVIFCRPVPLQIDLYKTAVDYWEYRLNSSNTTLHLSVVTALKKICNHPMLLIRNENNDDLENLNEHLHSFMVNRVPESPVVDNSGKLSVLSDLLCNLKEIGEKIVVISYFTQTLDLIETMCEQNSYPFSRLDGSTPVSTRFDVVERFNSPNMTNNFIFLLSAKAGGTGLNLIGASRLVLFDLDWNPASDLQAMSRIWRDGQRKNVVIYRFLTTGTIEEKIYQRQILKTSLSNAVIDPHNISDAKISIDELKDLFNLCLDTDSTTHDVLQCQCSGYGIPETEVESSDDDDDNRACQLSIFNDDGEKAKHEKKDRKINHLLDWEHYSPSVDNHILQELCLTTSASKISYIFRNKKS